MTTNSKSNSQALITVIIPVYNTGSYLHQSLQSVCDQTHSNLEIICIDDGSTDNSLSILREYEARDSRVKVLTSNHGGAAAARNIALDIAQGEWIIGLDSDDWLEPDAYEQVLRRASEDIDIVFFSALPVTDDENDSEWKATKQKYLRYYQHKERASVNMCLELITKTPVSPCLALRRHSIIQKYHLRFMEGHIHEDEDFHFHFMSHVRKAAFTSQRLYNRRLRAGSVMMNPDKETLADLVPLFVERLYKHYKETRVLGRYGKAISHMLLQRGYNAKVKEKSKMSMDVWREAVRAMARRCGMAQDSGFFHALAKIEGEEPTHIFRARLLFIPLWTWVSAPDGSRFKLFDVLPLWSTQSKRDTTTLRLLGIPLMKFRKAIRYQLESYK